MIYVTGDTHADIDITKLNSSHFPLQKQLTKDDYLIVTGDFGAVWDGGKQDKHIQKWWNDKNYTILFVDGNHENHDLLSSYPVTEWRGGRVHKISENIIHLMRGQVYNIDGCRILTIGGAQSHDMWCRQENVNWWKGELPTYDEAIEILDDVEAALKDGEIDYIITHCAPDCVLNAIDQYHIYKHDILSNLFNELIAFVPVKKWYCGHFHVDADLVLDLEENRQSDFCILYQRVVELQTGKTVNIPPQK